MRYAMLALVVLGALAACTAQTVTLTYQPKQCDQTPWQAWYGNGSIQFVKAPTDAELIIAYYGSKNITVDDVKRVDSGKLACQACHVCDTTYSFTVHVSPTDAARLEALNWTRG